MQYLCRVLKNKSTFTCCDSSCFSSAGYNNLEVAEYLLEHGADVNAQDKGGLIPLHNAASYGVSLYNIYTNPLLNQIQFLWDLIYTLKLPKATRN